MLGPLRLIITCAVGPWSAATFTAFLPHDEIAMSPPKLFTLSRAPGCASNVVSVRAVTVNAVNSAVASVSSIESGSPQPWRPATRSVARCSKRTLRCSCCARCPFR